MVIDWILILVGFIWVAGATISDIKTKEVPDWLNYSLIVIGLSIRGIYSLIVKDYWFFLYGLIGFAIFFVIANGLYYTKQWGGGDCKLLMGLGAVFGSQLGLGLFEPRLGIPFVAVVFINILIVGAIYGLIYSFILGLINWKKVMNELKKNDILLFLCGLFVGGIIALLSGFFFEERGFKFIGIALGILFFMGIGLVRVLKVIEQTCMHVWRSTSKLVEGDWLVEDIRIDGKLIVSKKGVGLESGDIAKIKKFKIKKVFIKDGVAFVPAFLISLIITFVFGNLLWFLF